MTALNEHPLSSHPPVSGGNKKRVLFHACERASKEPSKAGSEPGDGSLSVLSHQDRPGQQPGLLLDPSELGRPPAKEGPGPVDRAAPQEGHMGR